MKKFLTLLLALALAFAFIGCGETKDPADTPNTGDEDVKSEGVMTYDEYVAA